MTKFWCQYFCSQCMRYATNSPPYQLTTSLPVTKLTKNSTAHKQEGRSISTMVLPRHGRINVAQENQPQYRFQHGYWKAYVKVNPYTGCKYTFKLLI